MPKLSAPLLRPASESTLEVYSVSSYVNKPQIEWEKCASLKVSRKESGSGRGKNVREKKRGPQPPEGVAARGL